VIYFYAINESDDDDDDSMRATISAVGLECRAHNILIVTMYLLCSYLSKINDELMMMIGEIKCMYIIILLLMCFFSFLVKFYCLLLSASL